MELSNFNDIVNQLLDIEVIDPSGLIFVLCRLRDWTRIRVRRARTLIVVICTLLISVTSVMLDITVSVGAHLYLQLNRAC